MHQCHQDLTQPYTRRCRRRCIATPHSLARLLLLLVIFIQKRPSDAGFGQRGPQKANQETENAGQETETDQEQEEVTPKMEATTKNIMTDAESTATKAEIVSDEAVLAPPRP